LEPLSIAEHSYFWLGVETEKRPDGTTVATGEQMYVEYFVPADARQDAPLVLVHGGGGQGIAYFGRGDGKPGWLHYALAAGYTVYVIDRPGHGRNTPHPQLVGPVSEPTPFEAVTGLFAVGARTGRWEGDGGADDPGVAQFMAQQRPMRFDTAEYAHTISKRRGIELLERVGPAVILAHSAGGPFGWIAADARPELVKALIAVEVLGPTTVAIPLAYDPPISDPRELALEPVDDGPSAGDDAPALFARVRQVEPARKLANLSGVPILVVTSDDPRFAASNAASVAYLRQAGCTVDELRLADHGVAGNSHFMTLEENNDETFELIHRWLRAR
jgi:pimeloyl-ACP methyl ester carboxylesterase